MISLTKQPFTKILCRFKHCRATSLFFNRNYGGGYGHVGIVISATLDSITILEQNWLGGAYWNPPEVTTRRTHGYDFPMWFIRPFYAKETTANKLRSAVTPVKQDKLSKRQKKSCL
nr:CHAP domain-containing protein [Staphylococcus aureus]